MARDVVATDKRRIQDDDGDSLSINSDGALSVRDCEIQESVDGNAYYVEMISADLADGSSCTLGISVDTGGNKVPHGRFSVSVGGKAVCYLNEGVTFTGGSAITPYNINRNSDSLPTHSFVENPTVSDEGTNIETDFEGSSSDGRPFSNSAEPGSGEKEFWVLKKQTKYIVKVTNLSGSAINVKIGYTFHDHDID